MPNGGAQSTAEICVVTWSRERIHDADAGQWVPWREWVAAREATGDFTWAWECEAGVSKGGKQWPSRREWLAEQQSTPGRSAGPRVYCLIQPGNDLAQQLAEALPFRELTDRQRRFAYHYVFTCQGNGAEAARQAGYSPRNARQSADQARQSRHVRAAIDCLSKLRTVEDIRAFLKHRETERKECLHTGPTS